MNPQNFTLEDFDSLYSSSLILSDKETQTSKIYCIDSKPSIQSSSRPVPVNFDTCEVKPSPKVFEYVEVIKDPNDADSVTVIKDTFTEEVIDSSTFVGKSKSNRYKYCREIIEPFLKSPSKECPKESRDDLLTNSVQASDEKPDQQSCNEDYDCVKDIKDKIRINNSDTNMASKSDASKSADDSGSINKCLTVTNKKIYIDKNKCPNCENSSKTSVKSDSSKENCKEKNVSCTKSNTDCQDEDSKLKSCISKCLRSSINLAKKGSAACMHAIGIQQSSCDEKPTYYAIKKPPESPSCNSVKKTSSVQSILESHSQTLTTIKTAVQSFFGTVYKKTKDAVCSVTNESCKRLGLTQKSDSSISSDNSTTSKCSKKHLSPKSSKPVSSCAYDQVEKSETLHNTHAQSVGKLLQPALDVVGNIASSVESTVSYVKEFGMEKVIVDHVESSMNKSSPYDNVANNNTPSDVSQQIEPQSNDTSLFGTIKSKIFSMFQDSTMEADDNSEYGDDNDVLFDKFSEQ